ncbi:MAG: 30S ribosomal protein S20 [Bacteroidetes bacterium]|nr:30S ribosomal protein S20 [Bacteroidota bacterium]
MATHKSAEKRNRASEAKRGRNRIRKNAVKAILKKIRTNKDKKTASEEYIKASSLLDKLAKSNLIHKNKAANLKSKLAKHVNALK